MAIVVDRKTKLTYEDGAAIRTHRRRAVERLIKGSYHRTVVCDVGGR